MVTSLRFEASGVARSLKDSPMTLTLRKAGPDDAALVLDFVRQLAAFEKLSHEVDATLGDIEGALFCAQPRVFADIAEWDGSPVGFALWFYNFSTFRGRHGIYLEDLFVVPEFRSKGVGKALLSNLGRRCVEEGLARLEWWVLNWNEQALKFYRSIGAEPMDEWTVQRVSGEALRSLGASGAVGVVEAGASPSARS